MPRYKMGLVLSNYGQFSATRQLEVKEGVVAVLMGLNRQGERVKNVTVSHDVLVPSDRMQ